MNNDDINVLQRKQERWDTRILLSRRENVKWISRRVAERVESERTKIQRMVVKIINFRNMETPYDIKDGPYLC